MKRLAVSLVVIAITYGSSFSQNVPTDSVVIKVGESSRVIFAINKKDIPTLKYYDFQALMNDMIKKLESEDTASVNTPPEEYLKSSTAEDNIADTSQPETYEWPRDRDEDDYDRNDNDNDSREWETYTTHYRPRRTYHSISFDIGTNNFLSNGKFPDSNNDLYTVKPWGSWYVGINSIQRTRIAGKFFVEWGVGVSWYNFKFQDNKTVVSKDNTGVIFSTDTRDLDFMKSKLTASYVNASFIPILDFGGNRRKPMLFDGYHSGSFRIGVGPYVGYRIDSYSKLVYKENGDKKKDRDHDNYYLNNLRYGTRLQVGFQDIDLFFNYDMNELFSDGKGPQLNAFSFGITF